ncbi:MAG: hypothetical protein AAGL23_06335 [Pseudomonadota bacterium]
MSDEEAALLRGFFYIGKSLVPPCGRASLGVVAPLRGAVALPSVGQKKGRLTPAFPL